MLARDAMRFCGAAFFLAVMVAVAAAAADDQWPGFRGTNAGVAADEPGLPETWSTTENVRWAVDVPGLGWSSPVVWGRHVFVTSVISADAPAAPRPGFYLPGAVTEISPALHRWMLSDVDLDTGDVRWTRELSQGPPAVAKHLKNSYASETPVTDGERVYVSSASAGVFAFDFTGRQVWARKFGPFKTRNGWGAAASPVLHRDRLYIVNDNDEQSFLVALDARTGAEIWRVNRAEGTNWATPFVWEHDTRTEIVTSGSDRLRSYGLDGTLLWHLTGMSTISVPTPFARHGLLYVSSGYIGDALRPTYAIRPGASGDITLAEGQTSSAFIAWSSRAMAPYNPTPIVYGDIMYTLFDRGFFTAHDAKTGREIYPRQRIAVDASGFSASPWAYNGKIFALSEDGDTYVIQAGPDFKVLGKNSLGEMALASPAVVSGGLVIRTRSKLYRIGGGLR
jgi:outer membrane protein assembly factor BamB